MSKQSLTSSNYTRQSWKAMIQRCTNPNNESYQRYGGNHVVVCDRWFSFEKFLEDMGERPDRMTIDRINGSKIYSKETCKWSCQSEQAFNVLRKKNKCGVRGVRILPSGKYQVRISKKYSQISIGTYETLDEAKQARKEAEEKYYPGVIRPNRG